jgi:hypothetical protein
MSEDAQHLLMMFINDAYSPSARVKKRTYFKLLRFVAENHELQQLVNIGDEKQIEKFRL